MFQRDNCIFLIVTRHVCVLFFNKVDEKMDENDFCFSKTGLSHTFSPFKMFLGSY